MLSPYVTHRLPEFWNDPERFDPERFTADKMEQRHRFAYFPFGGGPRLCIGNNFALMEAPLLLTMLMQNFRFELIPDQHFELKPVATLRPQPALWMKVLPL
jgi:cytochrome P450